MSEITKPCWDILFLGRHECLEGEKDVSDCKHLQAGGKWKDCPAMIERKKQFKVEEENRKLLENRQGGRP